MRILFLCGSFEDGRDGVGDYTRRLAIELIKQGHEVAGIALNDQGVQENNIVDQQIGTAKFPSLRMPSMDYAFNKKDFIRHWINDFDPEWMSLQFVPFAYHPKGLPFKLGSFLNAVAPGRKWQIMFHELWVGMDTNATIKERFWALLQQTIIRSLIKKLRPSVLHTQTHLYKSYLSKLGYSAVYLPLFSNIPAPSQTNSLRDAATNKITFVVFGAIQGGAPIEEFAKDIAVYSQAKGIKVDLKIVGRFGSEHERWAGIWKSESLQVEILGEKSPAEISAVLNVASFGICTTPIPLIDKSGSVAAMREHGLPIVCVTRKWEPRGIKVDRSPGIFEYGNGGLENLFSGASTPAFRNSISEVALRFSNNLLSHS